MSRYSNLPRNRQSELFKQFQWLPDLVACRDSKISINQVALSFFDHCLSEEEADDLLGNVTPQQQFERDKKHSQFFKSLALTTELLGYKVCGRRQNKIKFRSFIEPTELLDYLVKRRWHGEYAFQVVLPEIGVSCFSGYDDTNHFFFEHSANIQLIKDIACDTDLYVW